MNLTESIDAWGIPLKENISNYKGYRISQQGVDDRIHFRVMKLTNPKDTDTDPSVSELLSTEFTSLEKAKAWVDQHPITESVVEPDTMKLFYRSIERKLSRYDKADALEIDGNNYRQDYRNSQFFTSRPGEEDDDHPDFTGRDDILKIVKSALASYKITPKAIEIYDHEKGWFTVEIEL